MDLLFCAVENPTITPAIILQKGLNWHEYGDTRWWDSEVWLEFDTACAGFPGPCGVLILCAEVPADDPDPFHWIANNCPLQWLFTEERSKVAIAQRFEKLRSQEKITEDATDPEDNQPSYVQCYCVYRHDGEPRLVASYMDLLNADGIPIPKYRMAELHPSDVEFCRFALHATFRLNQARLAESVEFFEEIQMDECVPEYLAPEQKLPRWAQFHPCRTLKTRPAIRALPTPTQIEAGIFTLADAQLITETRRLESNLHRLAFTPEARNRTTMSDDMNATMAAFTHRANGGAIYVLPDRLVEEFDNTDCEEIRMRDIKLPFTHLFLKFTPPQPLFLAEGAPVDGCYVIKQGDEYLFTLTARLDGVDYSQSLSIVCFDPMFSLHLPVPEFESGKPAPSLEPCVNEAVELGIKDFLDRNAPPTDNLSQTITRPDGTTANMVDVRAQSRRRRIENFRSQEPVFRACLNIIINAACFISFRPEDISEEWDGEIPTWVDEALKDTRDTRSARDRRRAAHELVARGEFIRIKLCGGNLFPDKTAEGSGSGLSPRAHWRRGHWRRQRHGPGLSLSTPRWIRPTVVMKDNGPVADARIYDIGSPGTDV